MHEGSRVVARPEASDELLLLFHGVGSSAQDLAPLGEVLAQAGRDDTLSVVRLSAQALQAARLTSPLPHRRTDLY